MRALEFSKHDTRESALQKAGNWYDVWYPNLAPSTDLVKAALTAGDAKAWAAFVRKYRADYAEQGVKIVWNEPIKEPTRE